MCPICCSHLSYKKYCCHCINSHNITGLCLFTWENQVCDAAAWYQFVLLLPLSLGILGEMTGIAAAVLTWKSLQRLLYYLCFVCEFLVYEVSPYLLQWFIAWVWFPVYSKCNLHHMGFLEKCIQNRVHALIFFYLYLAFLMLSFEFREPAVFQIALFAFLLFLLSIKAYVLYLQEA